MTGSAHARVRAYLKNQGLRLEVPYLAALAHETTPELCCRSGRRRSPTFDLVFANPPFNVSILDNTITACPSRDWLHILPTFQDKETLVL